MQRHYRNRRQRRRQHHRDHLRRTIELAVRILVRLAALEGIEPVRTVQHVPMDPGDDDVAEEAGEAVALRWTLGEGDEVALVPDVPVVLWHLEEEAAVVFALEPGAELG